MTTVKTKPCLAAASRKSKSAQLKRNVTFNNTVVVYDISPVRNTQPYVDPFETYAQQEFLRLTNRLKNKKHVVSDDESPDECDFIDEEARRNTITNTPKAKSIFSEVITVPMTSEKKPSNVTEKKLTESTNLPEHSTPPDAKNNTTDVKVKKKVRKVVRRKKKVVKKQESEEELSCEEIS
ncbi:unnamed protein product [Bursaphelenchus okinawaensis]|uniref:Uncharacterized protein n=1 Tax=Bursaphelenchus okinawaensis TaxID=465554 RepID=A0A811L5C3_9BILA|nr:unnamed protein product [Bursaphelenchus okinawaensis]CAG9119836.1 unnamed protein product [Bursaphelenchus okinawaensis]